MCWWGRGSRAVPYLPGDLEPLSSEESEALWELQELRRCERQAGDSLRDLRRGRPGPRDRLSGRGGHAGTQRAPLPPPARPSPLALFVFLFPFVLGASGPAGRDESCRRGSGGSTWGCFLSPQRHPGCGRSEGKDLPGLELGSTEVQSVVGIPDGFGGTVGSGAGW